MTDGAGTETRAYDNLNRLTRVTRGTDTFAYLYDLAANLTRRTYPDGTITDYTFDDDSRMVTVSSGGATTSYGYDAAGNRTTTTLPAANGHLETRTYDRAGRLTRMTSERAGTTLVDLPTASTRSVTRPKSSARAHSQELALTRTTTATSLPRSATRPVALAQAIISAGLMIPSATALPRVVLPELRRTPMTAPIGSRLQAQPATRMTAMETAPGLALALSLTTLPRG